MKSAVALVLLSLIAIQFVPVTLAEQTASAHALSQDGRAYDITLQLGSRIATIRSCDLTTRLGSTSVVHYNATKSSPISVPNPQGGSTALGLHLEINSTAIALAADFVTVNGQLTAVDGSATDHENGQAPLTIVALPVALIPSGLPVC